MARRLTPWPARDVVEPPLTAELDVTGSDLAKALKLLMKGDAVVIEWPTFPLVYEVDPGLRDDLLAFAARFARREAVGRHDLHLGQRHDREFIAGRDRGAQDVGLRPASRGAAAVAGAAAGGVCGAHVAARADGGVRAVGGGGGADGRADRAQGGDAGDGRGACAAALVAFMRGEFEAAAGWAEADGAPVDAAAAQAAVELYRRTVERLG